MIKKTVGAVLVAIFVASNACAEQIPLERSGGVYTLPVLINNVLTLKFVLDSGAAEVSIPIADVREGTVRYSSEKGHNRRYADHGADRR